MAEDRMAVLEMLRKASADGDAGLLHHGVMVKGRRRYLRPHRMTAVELDLMGDRPETRGEAEDGVDRAEPVFRLDPEASPRGWREAEFAGKQADLFAVVTDHLVERVLDQAPGVPHEGNNILATPAAMPHNLRYGRTEAPEDTPRGDPLLL